MEFERHWPPALHGKSDLNGQTDQCDGLWLKETNNMTFSLFVLVRYEGEHESKISHIRNKSPKLDVPCVCSIKISIVFLNLTLTFTKSSVSH
jgi:hypothetical protein